MQTEPNIKPLSPRKAVEHPRYPDALLQAAAHFLSKVPTDITGRKLISVLSFGSAEEIKRAGIVLWASVPHARDAAHRIDALARHMLAIEDYRAAKAKPAPAPEPCALTEAIKRAGIPLPPPDVIERIKQVVGIKPGDEVQVTLDSVIEPEDDEDEGEDEAAVNELLASLDGAMQDDDHGLPMECFIAMQKKMPGIRVVQRKVISCPTLPVPLAQAILDMTLAKAKQLGLM